MDRAYRFVPKMVWILGMAFAAAVMVQFCKFSYDRVFTTLVSAGKFAYLGTETNSTFGDRDNPSPAVAWPSSVLPISPAPSPTYSGRSSKGETALKNSTSQGRSGTGMSISRMDGVLLESQFSPNSTPPLQSSAVGDELIYVKSEIQNAPLVPSSYSGLHGPLFRNVSRFIRSYDLMEKILKVYIYKEGEKPIFHEAILDGIYASEGWFLKLIGSNKRFITEDPKKAHLFYLPFSSRLLQQTLYVRNSHSRKNLVDFMRNYVEMLIHKHPFWNRTNGEDHFLAACHDWAPAETRGKMLGCLRALCNADLKAGFIVGKDVSLPTVYVRSAKDPLRGIGGAAATNRSILAFFAGFMHGNVRPVLVKHWRNDPDMKIMERLPHDRGDKIYIQYMKSSKYCICARGYAVHSPRVVESILYECVPVIISDNYVPPFFEVLNWNSFAVFIMEDDIPNLKKILMSITEDKYVEMQKGVKEVQKHFLWHEKPVKYDMFHMILHSVWYNKVFRTKSA